MSTYGSQALVEVEHPNGMGTDDSNGLSAERARLQRFRSRFVYRELHYVAIGRTKGIFAMLFRRTASPIFLAKCAQKTCFRTEDLSISVPPASRVVRIDNVVRHTVERSLSSVADATSLYGEQIVNELQLGFSKPFSIHQLRAHNAQLPLVDDCISATNGALPLPQEVLSVVVSYRHTTPIRGHILNIDGTEWPEIAKTAAALCEAAGRTAVRLWTDQILSQRKPSAILRWVSSGVLPYAIYPVLYVHSNAAQLQRNLRRMWISVEHLMAAFGQGIVHVGDALAGDELPLEWGTTFVRVRKDVNWMLGLGNPLRSCVRKLCAALMCGLVRNKEMSWQQDAQDLLDWASAITSAVLFQDIAHSFDCDDCRQPLGYTAGQRFMALYSSGVVIDPKEPEVVFNGTHPRLDVPAVALQYEGKAWDGFREWIPESCLWGLKEDQNKQVTVDLMKGTRALVLSCGGGRAVAVMQFCSGTTQENVLVTANLLVGLEKVRNGARLASVEWSKRFWPVYPLRMWISFETVWKKARDHEALVELREIVSASAGYGFTNLTETINVDRLSGRQIHWS
eukprot:TRINITY_DN24600_c0_g1_i1.p1 TRINITY_DN24600_c0_g1~~TRINITY_DN24600_c0_g1_i1.p1  ORF type:complete len:629 (-),score=67.39 TRINITY_DN24600_c0_g1_i1:564-2261(-)